MQRVTRVRQRQLSYLYRYIDSYRMANSGRLNLAEHITAFHLTTLMSRLQ